MSAKRKKPANMKDLPERALTDDEASQVTGGSVGTPPIRPPIDPCWHPPIDPCWRPRPSGH